MCIRLLFFWYIIGLRQCDIFWLVLLLVRFWHSVMSRWLTMSVHSFANCTGWRQGSELISSSLSLSISVDDLSQLADLEDRCRLHSASSPLLIARCTWLSTIDDRTFSVTAACVWNRLPQHVISAPSLSVCLPQPPVDTPLQALLSSSVTAIVTIVPKK